MLSLVNRANLRFSLALSLLAVRGSKRGGTPLYSFLAIRYKMIGYKQNLGKSMLGFKMPLGKSRIGNKMPLLDRPTARKVEEALVRKVSGGLERNVLKR